MTRSTPWTPQDVAILRRDYPETPTRAIAARLGRETGAVRKKANTIGLLKTASAPGAAGQFKPGHVPHNKGKKGWQAGGRSAHTRFKPGHRGNKYQPIGAQRLSKDGYLQRKITNTGYPPRDWKGVHILLWEAHNGPVPPGRIVVFRNRDKRDIRIDNLECIERVENMRRNSIHRLPKPLAEICQLKGAIQRQINKRDRREKQN